MRLARAPGLICCVPRITLRLSVQLLHPASLAPHPGQWSYQTFSMKLFFNLVRTASLFAVIFTLAPQAIAAPGIDKSLPVRLPGHVVPTDYQLAITVDPDIPTHSGEVTIALQLKKGSKTLRLHAENIVVSSARLTIAASGKTLQGKARQLDQDYLEIAFDKPLPTGAVHLTLAFTGQIEEKDASGLFRQKEGGDWYAFTQFESMGARKAFPSFDEPGWKVPFALSLTVPASMTAVATAPAVRETALPSTDGGKPMKRVDFATTKRIPTYLLAWGVGPFDILDGGTVGNTPIRFITPKGRAVEATFAASVTPPILEKLEAYFGSAYPYEKLDVMALPFTLSFGAMENPGLVTFASSLMLAKPGEESDNFKRRFAGTQAHELAHMWFGNLVTMAWWDDLWLNESFASWMGDKITSQAVPELSNKAFNQGARAWAMGADRKASSQPIYKPVTQRHSSGDSLSGQNPAIIYGKGQSVLTMFETWLGPEKFQAGVRRYTKRHAWGNATNVDFVTALGDGDAKVQAAFRSFIHQSGIPRVGLELQCSGKPMLRVTQSRFEPGSASGRGVAKASPLWRMPITVRTPAGVSQLLLTGKTARFALPDTTCPTWLVGNVNGAGYYLAAYPKGVMNTMMEQANLSVPEWVGALNDAFTLTETGDLGLDEALAMAARLSSHPEREVSEAALNLIARTELLVQPAEQAAYAAFWQRSYGAQARALGLVQKPVDTRDDRLNRAAWVGKLADSGQDASLRTEAQRLAHAWLQDKKAVSPLDLSLVLGVAALDGDKDLFDAFVGKVTNNPDRRERATLYNALGRFQAPELAQAARALLIAPEHDAREILSAARSRDGAKPVRDGQFAFIARNMDAIAQRLPEETMAGFPFMFQGFCSLAQAREVEQLFKPRLTQFRGMERRLQETLESINLCANHRAIQAANLRSALGLGPGL